MRAPSTWPRLLRLGGCCEVCRGWSPSRLCAGCRSHFATARTRCTRCALALPAGPSVCGSCLHEPPAYDQALCLGDYAFPWDRLVTRLKFHDQPELASLLAEHLFGRAAAEGRALPDVFVPVPLSAARLAERGYDQAWELARALARRTGRPARAQALQRRFDGSRQSSLPRAQRLSNLRGAFAVGDAQRSQVAGLRVGLVDDVLTTGATAHAAASALREAGARAVDLWVVARTPSPME